MAGCDKDEFELIGTWEQVKSEMTINFGIPGLQNFIISDTDPVTVVFRADGTGTFTDADGTDTFNWTLSGDVLTISDSEATLSLNLTTKTKDKLVGTQTLTLQQFIAFGDFDEEDLEFYQEFPNLTVTISLELKKK